MNTRIKKKTTTKESYFFPVIHSHQWTQLFDKDLHIVIVIDLFSLNSFIC